MITFIRPEIPEDHEAIRRLHVEAFETEGEANLVETLRASEAPCLSLVSESLDGTVVGHIFFSPMILSQVGPDLRLAGLAPMAVLPKYQRQGIGTTLVEEGLVCCGEVGYAAVFALGHLDFYKRFRFVPAKAYGINSEYEVPAEMFMVRELRKGVLTAYSGTVQYHELFQGLG